MSTVTQKAYVSYAALVGRVLSNHRQRLGMQQPQVAERLNIVQASLSRIETGQAVASIEQLAILADLFGTTPGELLAEADRAAAIIERQGHKVIKAKSEAAADWKPLATVVLTGLLLAAVFGGKK